MIKPGKYRHYKGNEYEVYDIAKHSETLEDMVVYRAQYGEHGLWARPAGMWEEIVNVDGKEVVRFAKIQDADYDYIVQAVKAIVANVDNEVSNMANVAAILWECMSNLNWVGFYVMRNGELQLGPFQGKTACTRIAVGKGVCGTAVAEDKTQLVVDVHEFPGHIACDSASNSEIVVPIHKDGKVWGVLDIDSPSVGRFDEEDRKGLEHVVEILEKTL